MDNIVDYSTRKIINFIEILLKNIDDVTVLHVEYVIPNEGEGIALTHVVLQYQKMLEIKYDLDGIYVYLKGFTGIIETLIPIHCTEDLDFNSNMIYGNMLRLLTLDQMSKKIESYIKHKGE